MKPLLKLWLLKIKGTIRNLFKRKASGVFVIIMILFYGAMIVSLFNQRFVCYQTFDQFLEVKLLCFLFYFHTLC